MWIRSRMHAAELFSGTRCWARFPRLPRCSKHDTHACQLCISSWVTHARSGKGLREALRGSHAERERERERERSVLLVCTALFCFSPAAAVLSLALHPALRQACEAPHGGRKSECALLLLLLPGVRRVSRSTRNDGVSCVEMWVVALSVVCAGKRPRLSLQEQQAQRYRSENASGAAAVGRAPAALWRRRGTMLVCDRPPVSLPLVICKRPHAQVPCVCR